MKPTAVLIGPPGAGKTSAGRRLAELLDVQFADTDDLIEERVGKPIPDIFIEDGEPEFRRHERAVVHEALAAHGGILALGGGAILDPDTRAELSQHRVVLLTVGLAAASPRVGFTGSRPLLLGSPRRQWLALMQEREPLYAEVADLTVPTDELTVGEVAEIILHELQRMETDDDDHS